MVADGKNGVDGKDGTDGKNIEVQRTTEYIQWRYEGENWQNLVAISDIKGPTGQNGKDGANGKTPEFRVNENNLQWRYVSEEIWLNLTIFQIEVLTEKTESTERTVSMVLTAKTVIRRSSVKTATGGSE